MVDTDMISWIANGAASQQQDMYSVTTKAPTVLAENAYTTTFELETNNIIFTSTRSMTATSLDTYDIPLDTTFNMIYSFQTNVTKVSYHGPNKATF